MKKKKLAFVADSIVNLFKLYEYLRDKYEIIWIVHHEDIAFDLKKRGVNLNSIFYVNPYGFLNKKFFPFLLIRKILNLFLNVLVRKILVHKINNISEHFRPNLWITDSGILSEVKTLSPKCTFKHSITYKRHYLGDNISNFDYVFLPGLYHLNRIQNIHPKKINKNKLIVTGSLKVSNYVNKAELDLFEKQEFHTKNNLSIENKNVLFAPTHDAHSPGRFLPNSFGNQFEAIEKISNFVNDKLNCNFIIKLHHYQSNLLKKKIFKQISDKKNNMVFDLAKFHDVDESENVIRISDIIITDTSGVGPIGIFLGKSIIFLEPEISFNWKVADLESNLRPGFICKQLEEVYVALKKYLNSQDLFLEQRKDFVEKVFFQHNKDARNEISNVIDKIINNKMIKGNIIENYSK